MGNYLSSSADTTTAEATTSAETTMTNIKIVNEDVDNFNVISTNENTSDNLKEIEDGYACIGNRSERTAGGERRQGTDPEGVQDQGPHARIQRS